jgi:hypothetical protein
MNIPLPFSLVSNDVTSNKLIVMPAYWFMYNLYALARNAAKYADRDKRTKKLQFIEFNFLAPDSVNEIFTALHLLRKFTAWAVNPALKKGDEATAVLEGDQYLNDDSIDFKKLEVVAEGFECTNRTTQLIKVKEAYAIYKKLIVCYAVEQMVLLIEKEGLTSFDELLSMLTQEVERTSWINVGGQLIPEASLNNLLNNAKNGTVNSWNDIHNFYLHSGKQYPEQKRQHAFASLLELLQLQKQEFTVELFTTLMQDTLTFKQWMFDNIQGLAGQGL